METKEELSFEEWFKLLVKILDAREIIFRDPDAVIDDYEEGKTVETVANDITAEYNE